MTAPATVTTTSLVERAQAIAPRVAELADDIERERRQVAASYNNLYALL
jgi:hypothetical protein